MGDEDMEVSSMGGISETEIGICGTSAGVVADFCEWAGDLSDAIDFFVNSKVSDGRFGRWDAPDVSDSDFPDKGKESSDRDFRGETGVRGELSPDEGKGIGAVSIVRRVGSGMDSPSLLDSSRVLPIDSGLDTRSVLIIAGCCSEETSDTVEGVAMESVEVVKAGRWVLLSLDVEGESSSADRYEAVSS
jgi:hypothetical protein